jgi:hypothetical protein
MRGLLFGLAGGLAALLFVGQASAEHCNYGRGYSVYRSTTVRSYGGYGYAPTYAPGFGAGYAGPGYGGYGGFTPGYGYAPRTFARTTYGSAFPGGGFYRSSFYRSYGPAHCRPYGYGY